MLKALMKKQLMELNQSLFVNMKSGERKPRAKVILSITMFAVLMIVIIGGIFWQMAESMSPLIKAGAGWLYMLIMAAVSVALGTFGSVFNTYASLYLAKDNDLLLSMPIPVSVLLTSRLLGVYLMGLLYSGIVILPAVIVYWAVGGGRCDAGKRAGRRAADCADLRFCHDAVLRAGVGGREDQPAEA